MQSSACRALRRLGVVRRKPVGPDAEVARFSLPMLGCSALAGCSMSPSIPVLGAYFPDWLFCIVGAVAATALVHAGLAARGLADRLGPAPLVYPTLLLLFSLVAWLIFFRN